jgi:hypothetical protein
MFKSIIYVVYILQSLATAVKPLQGCIMHRQPKGYFSPERKITGAGRKLRLLLAHAT